MDRRLADLELKGYEEELHRRNQTLDILHADKMRYWLAGWKQSYALAFDAEHGGPELSEKQCLARIRDLEAFIAEREKNQDPGTAEIYRNWLAAFAACYEKSVAQQPDGDGAAAGERTPPRPGGRRGGRRQAA